MKTGGGDEDPKNSSSPEVVPAPVQKKSGGGGKTKGVTVQSVPEPPKDQRGEDMGKKADKSKTEKEGASGSPL
eukprot:14611994-Alexandrium_andersonii.AAC.1